MTKTVTKAQLNGSSVAVLFVGTLSFLTFLSIPALLVLAVWYASWQFFFTSLIAFAFAFIFSAWHHKCRENYEEFKNNYYFDADNKANERTAQKAYINYGDVK